MVSNYDRILLEITEEAQRVTAERSVDSETLITLAMEIVDLEDQHRIKGIRIKQLVEERILAAAIGQLATEDSQ